MLQCCATLMFNPSKVAKKVSSPGKYTGAPVSHSWLHCELLSDCTAARHQVNDGNNDRENQQQVNQATRNMESPTQQPQNQQNRKNGPKHRRHPGASWELAMRLRGRRFERSWLGPAKELLQSYLNHPSAARRSCSGGDAKRPAALEFGNRCELLNRLQTRPDIACELAYRTHLVGGLAWKIWRAQGQLGREQYPGNCAAQLCPK